PPPTRQPSAPPQPEAPPWLQQPPAPYPQPQPPPVQPPPFPPQQPPPPPFPPQPGPPQQGPYPPQQPTQQWQQPTQQWVPPQPQWDQPPWAGGPGGPPSKRRKRLPLIIALVAVVVAGLVAGGIFLFKGKHSPSFTYDGQAIDQPDQPLKQAGAVLDSMIKSRHGAKSDDTRCYYGVPRNPAGNAKKTDIDHSAWCGPVAFVDGDPSKQYLSFALNSTPAKGGKVTLTASDKPSSTTPQSVPADLQLKRPDSAKAPSGPGGVAIPAPPPADKNSVVTAVLGKQTIPAAPKGAAMGTTNGGVAITKLGPIQRYGTGDDARSAPDGQKLIAFQVDGTDNDNGDNVLLAKSLTVSVDGASGPKLPDPVDGQPYIVAVPTAAKSVDLVLNDAGVKQTVSLLSGKPGGKNIAVYARSDRTQTLFRSGHFTFRFSQTVVLPNGSEATTQAGNYVATVASLRYSIPSKHATASRTSDALLYIDIGYTVAASPGKDFGFPTNMMTFTPTGGRPIKARNLASAGLIYNVFEVPANLTTGTLQIAGAFRSKFTNTGATYTTTLTAPIKVPVSFPAS
ncbi:MAG TPA: hypothetical protein VH373_11130, partial [Jatrophihabitantaceae bacterium]